MASASFAQLLPMITDQLDSDGEVSFNPRGTSMLPFLMEGRDTVVLAKPPKKLKKGDIPFYRRSDGAFVLHRIVGLGRDGSYTLCGDNQFRREYGIRQEQIIAVVKEVTRKGKRIGRDDTAFRLWGVFWPKFKLCASLPSRIYHKLGRIIGR